MASPIVDQIFEYEPHHRVIICRLCHHVVFDGQLTTHLRDTKHTHERHSQHIPLFQQYYQQFPQRIQHHHALVIPQEPIPPIPGLIPPQYPTYQCRDPGCHWIGETIRRIHDHSRQQHGWENPHHRGRRHSQTPHAPPSNMPWTMVASQQFIPRGRGSQRFAVQHDHPTTATIARRDKTSWDTAQQAMKQEIIRREQQIDEAERARIRPHEPREVNPWVERMGWANHLMDEDRGTLRILLKPPDPDHEPVLAQIEERFHRIVMVAQRTTLTRLNVFSRFEMHRKQADRMPQQPFQARMVAGTMEKYTEVWQQIIRYIMRSVGAGDARFQLSATQSEAIHQIQQAMSPDDPTVTTTPSPVPEEMDPADQPLDAVDRAILTWCIAMLDHPLPGQQGQEFANGIISGLAVMGIQEQGGWETALTFTPKLSAIIKIARMLVAQQAWEEAEAHPGLSNCFVAVRAMMLRFMTTMEPTPMKWMLDSRTYGMKIRYSTTAEGLIAWHGDQITYQHYQFTMDQFRETVQGIVNRAWDHLTQKVLLIPAEHRLPTITWETMEDHAVEDQPGWYFAQDPRNAWDVDDAWWLHDHIWQDPELRRTFIHAEHPSGPSTGPSTTHTWRPRRVQRWMRDVGRMKEYLLVLMHLTSGAPARGPEAMSIRYQNTPFGGLRNQLIERGLVSFMTTYHKGYHIQGRPKVIHRYVPRAVGELFIYYQRLAMPFQRHVETMVYGQPERSGYIWPPQEVDNTTWTSERMKRAMQRETEIGMGVRLTISACRQIMIAMGRRYLGPTTGFESDPMEDEQEMEEDEDGCWWTAEDAVIDIQAGHGSHVAGMIYARGVEEAPGTMAAMKAQFRQASERWHRLLGFSSPHRAGMKRKRGMAPGDPRSIAQWQAMRDAPIQPLLERIVGPTAQFQGIQKAAIDAVMGSAPWVLGVMGTGGGKSMIFMVPAAWERAGTSIVVVPTVSLRQDMQRECAHAGISCVPWDSHRPPETARIVLVTPESATRKGFRSYISRLQERNRLDRIVIDECHTILDSREEFRRSMADLHVLMTVGRPVVLLTATLPAVDEVRLFQRLQLPPTIVQRFRSPHTTRVNIAYQVSSMRADADEDEIVAFIRQREAHWHPTGGKVIIYRSQTGDVDTMAARLGCLAYHGKMATAAKERALQAFTQPPAETMDAPSRSMTIVATNALGIGINIPTVRCIIHVEVRRMLRDYSQESGRAGRDGQASEAIIIAPTTYQAPGWSEWEAGCEEGKQAMRTYFHSTTCRRTILDAYLDSYERPDGCTDGEAACDRCTVPSVASPVHAPDVMATWMAQEQQKQAMARQVQQIRGQQAMTMDQLEPTLSQWQHRCPVCYIETVDMAVSRHPITACSHPDAVIVRGHIEQMTRAMREQRKYARFSCCFACGVPQAICQRYEANPNGGWRGIPGRECQFPDVVIPTVISIMHCNPHECAEVVYTWMKADGVDVEEADPVYTWFGQKIRWSGMEGTRLIEVFYQLSQFVIAPASPSHHH